MRASELMGREVVDRDGGRVGTVVDLRCELDGPLLGVLAAPRVHALVVSHRFTGSLLGYDRRSQRGPWLVATLVRRLHRHLAVVPWDLVADPGDPIRLRVGAANLPPGPS
jgi:sporulation protein YlmC with PRC-barrel domain